MIRPETEELAGLRLTVSALARRLGITPATLRTWDRRYGVGPTGHSAGSHRRYAAADVERLEDMQRALINGASPAEAARLALGFIATPPLGATKPSGSAGVGRRAKGLARAVLALDGATASQLLQRSVEEIGLVRTWDEVARPAVVSIADRWARTGAGIEVEHLLSEVITTVVAQVGVDAAAPVSRRPVLLGSMPGERHGLPLRVLAATLAQRGVGVVMLGTDVPQRSLMAAIGRTAPAAVFVWSHMVHGAELDLLAQLPRTRPRMRCYVGGSGWDGYRLPVSVVHLASLAEAGNVLTASAGL